MAEATLPKKSRPLPSAAPVTAWSADDLAAIFGSAEKRILAYLKEKGAVGYSTRHHDAMLESVRGLYGRALKDMDKWIKDGGLADAYINGSGRAVDLLKKQAILDAIMADFSKVDDMALRAIAERMRSSMQDAGDKMLRNVDDVFRRVGTQETVRALLTGEPVKDVAVNIHKELSAEGISVFVDKAGREWDLETYSRMVARTTQAHADREGFVMRMAQNDQDLMEITGPDDELTRPACHDWVGKVISLSGKNPDYPSLEEARADGVFGPNCRHDLIWSDENMRQVENEDAA